MTPSKVYTYDTANSDYGGGIPGTAQSVAPYIDRHYANSGAAKSRFPHLFESGMVQFITAGSLYVDVLDWEPGNADPDAGNWAKAAAHAGVWRPMVYADLDDLKNHNVLSTLEHAFGSAGGDPAKRPYRIWTAHPGQGEHICGPDTCGQLSVKANMTQYWWGSIDGHGSVDMDISVSLPEAWKALADKPVPLPKARPSMQYQRYDTERRTGKGAPPITEARAAAQYDTYRMQQTRLKHPHRPELAVLRGYLRWYAERVASLMIANAPKGHRLDLVSQRSKAEHWGWRYARLVHRSQGKLIKPEV